MSRNYSQLMKEPALAEKFLKAFWGEKMMAAILMCQQPNMALQGCLAAKNNDIMQCQMQAVEVEHCPTLSLSPLILPSPSALALASSFFCLSSISKGFIPHFTSAAQSSLFLACSQAFPRLYDFRGSLSGKRKDWTSGTDWEKRKKK